METIREQYEQEEVLRLSHRAALSINTRGRKSPETPCPIRTCYQQDKDRILHSKAFRRLAHKTQVWVLPRGDHYRRRLQHTLEVAQVSRTVARALKLNEDLTEAIALAHDIGHQGLGHAGEDALRKVLGHFEHAEQSIRVLDVLENSGKGLNLSYEVLDGVLNHTGETPLPSTLEGQIVKILDKTYTIHDLDDAIRAGILTMAQVPADVRSVLGDESEQQLNIIVQDMIYANLDSEVIALSPRIHQTFYDLRSFMYERVYLTGAALKQSKKVEKIIQELFYYFCGNTDELPEYLQRIIPVEGVERVVADYISGMTDSFALRTFNHIFTPESL